MAAGEGDAVRLDGGQGSGVHEGSAEAGDAAEAACSEGAHGELAARVDWWRCGHGWPCFLSFEERLAAHGAGVGRGLLEPLGDAAFAEGVLARQLDRRLHGVYHADGAGVGVRHWCQTSGEEVGASWKRHLRSGGAVQAEGNVCGNGVFPVCPDWQERACLTSSWYQVDFACLCILGRTMHLLWYNHLCSHGGRQRESAFVAAITLLLLCVEAMRCGFLCRCA